MPDSLLLYATVDHKEGYSDYSGFHAVTIREEKATTLLYLWKLLQYTAHWGEQYQMLTIGRFMNTYCGKAVPAQIARFSTSITFEFVALRDTDRARLRPPDCFWYCGYARPAFRYFRQDSEGMISVSAADSRDGAGGIVLKTRWRPTRISISVEYLLREVKYNCCILTKIC